MKIYIDGEFKCHVSPGDGLTAAETDFFDGKAPGVIEGYRFVPEGQSWTRSDGVVFAGEMVSPWMDWEALDGIQRAYEREQAAKYTTAMWELDTAYEEGVDSL